MTDTELLLSCIKSSTSTMGELAKKLKLSRQGFWKKLHNKSEFKQSEIAAITKELNLDADTERRIFFTLNVD